MGYKEDQLNDKKNLHTLRSGNVNQTLVNAAYVGARHDKPNFDWMNVAATGVESFANAYEEKKANAEAEHKLAMNQIEKNAQKVYDTAGSLPEQYFDQSWTQVEELRNRYAEAVKSGDTKEQHKIKGELNTYGEYIKSIKDTVK